MRLHSGKSGGRSARPHGAHSGPRFPNARYHHGQKRHPRRLLDRLIRLVPGKKYHVQIIVDDTIATLYVDGVALNTRMYTNPGEGICLGVTDGSAVFENQSIAYL